MEDIFGTEEKCEERRKEYGQKLADHETRLAIMESALEQLTSVSKLILGAVCSGMVSIIVILLTRGI